MKLRHRFALTFAIASFGTLLAARLVTIESFRRLQEYELDQELRKRAREEGNEVTLRGRAALEAEYAEKEESDPLEQLVTYGALYRADGSVVADTASFAHAPPLSEIGAPPARPAGAPFDFRFHGRPLRGVIVEVSSRDAERQYLLFATSRGDMDADAKKLLAVGWWVVLACMPVALALGWWLGRRMTKGIEALASAAGRVTAGELEMVAAHDLHDDEVVALGASLRDMVGRLKALIETERRFASHAAHELRSPLAALRGELELALRRPRSGEEYEGTLRDALEDTNRLVDLAEDLLTIARIEGGPVEGLDEEVDVALLVRDAVDASMARTPADVSIDAGPGRVVVRGARVALVRAVRNLVDNAVVHGGAAAGGREVRVRVRAEESEDSARIEIEDDGPGIAAEDRDWLFEPFHRAARARQEPGSGLGLGIAREVARRYGGDVLMDSPANPTRFVVRLRRAATG